MIEVVQGDARRIPLSDGVVQCVVTSPPYWGLRDYGIDGQIGLERAPDEYVTHLVEVFREIRRVLRDDGVAWLNLGDSYATNPGNGRGGEAVDGGIPHRSGIDKTRAGLKPKDLVGIPWMVAFALRADGWYLRSEIIWHKLNPMPESVTDRPTKAHEQVFLLSKRASYFYDADAIMEPVSQNTHARISQDLANQVGSFRAAGGGKTNGPMRAVVRGSTRKIAEAGSGIKQNESFEAALALGVTNRNKRSVWTIATQSYSGAHFATFPEKLVEPCVLAGTSARGACPKCGAGWVRIVENGDFIPTRWRPGDDKTLAAQRMVSGADGPSPTSAMVRGGVNERITTGWRPSCDCDAGEPVSQIVLYPFAGTGTVGRVCARYGRSFVGIELKREYIELAQGRTSGVQITMDGSL